MVPPCTPTLAPLGPVDLLRTEVAFRRLWYAQLVSEAGDWFQIVALLTLLPTVGGKSHVVAGYLVVRLLRGKTLIVCDLLRAAIVLLYVFVVRGDGSTNVPLLYALSFIQEGLAAFFEPARGALIPQVVPTRGLLSANAISGASWSAML